MTTVLVTGTRGFIGSHLAARLAADERTNLVVLQSEGVAPWGRTVMGRLERLTPQAWTNGHIDHIDTVYHLGGFTPKSMRNADDMKASVRDNIRGTVRLLETLPRGVERVVFASTVDVYDWNETARTINEQSPVRARNAYAASKLVCEELVRSHALDNHYEYRILRYGSTSGVGEERYHKLIPETVRRLERREPVVLFGEGKALLDIIHVDDVVEATLRAGGGERSSTRLLNIVRGSSRSVQWIVEKLNCLMGNGEMSMIHDPLDDKRSLEFDNRLMMEVLGHWDLIEWEAMLEQVVNARKAWNR